MECSTPSYIREENLVTRSIAGETIIVPVNGRVCDLDSIYTLDEVGSAIWRVLEDWVTAEGIVEGVLREFDAPGDAVVAGDVASFLGELEVRGLIRSRPAVEALP